MVRILAFLIPLVLLVAVGLAGDSDYKDPEWSAAEQGHWAYQPPKRAMPPRAGHPIDAFLDVDISNAGLKPNPEADARTLVRRVHFDLHGLPPTSEQAEAFVRDPSPQAYGKLIDDLLASPHYAERWARHWLDVVRFAESNGYELDGDRPHAWRYRDYVVQSFHADKPYDRFVFEQLAGDLLAETASGNPIATELRTAVGWLRCGPVHLVAGNVDPAETRQEVLTEMVGNLGAAVLGLTVACARCHDHKFDAISLGDYYRLEAYFAGTQFHDVSLADDEAKAGHKAAMTKYAVALTPITKAIRELEGQTRDALTKTRTSQLDEPTQAALAVEKGKRTAAQKKLVDAAGPTLKLLWDEVIAALPEATKEKRAKLVLARERIVAERPEPLSMIWSVKEQKSPVPTHVLLRGSLKRPGPIVPLMPVRATTSKPLPQKSRLDLAKELTRPDHPLTARVIVNRLWQHHFGRGLVSTPNDFGTRGGKPSHPALLDWLAVELVQPSEPNAVPWTLNRLHKLMMTSAAYKRTSTPNAEAMKLDPENKRLSRMNRRRLEAETLRDAALATAGTLNRKIGGPSVRVPLEPEVEELIFTEDEPSGLWQVTRDPAEHTRRSLYLYTKRNVRLPLFEAFDQPDSLGSCAMRDASIYAPQALILMNGKFIRDQAERFAANLVNEPREGQIAELYRRAFARKPTVPERDECLRFLAQPGSTLADLAIVVMNLNEFIYVD